MIQKDFQDVNIGYEREHRNLNFEVDSRAEANLQSVQDVGGRLQYQRLVGDGQEGRTKR